MLVSPTEADLLVGEPMQFMVTPAEMNEDAPVVWTVSSNVGEVDQSGRFVALHSGVTNVTATRGEVSASARVTVSQRVPTELIAVPNRISLLPSGQEQVAVTVLDQRGDVLEGSPLEWRVEDASVASVVDGLVTVRTAGSTVVTVSSGDAVATVDVAVRRIMRLQLAPGRGDVFMNEPLSLVAQFIDSDRNLLSSEEAGREVNYVITGESTASSVSVDGQLTAVLERTYPQSVTVRATIANPQSTSEARIVAEHTFDIQVRLVDLSCLQERCCGVDRAGTTYCWGENSTAPVVSANHPIPLLGLPPLRTVVVGSALCGLDSGGQAWCWGSNNYGQLGRGTFTSVQDPGPVLGPYRFEQLVSGTSTMCGLTVDREIVCWGARPPGHTGVVIPPDPDVTNEFVPVPYLVDEGPWAEILMDASTLCAAAPDGEWWCLGGNRWGVSSVTPDEDRVADLRPIDAHDPPFREIAPSARATCALDDAGNVWCWGTGAVMGALGREVTLAPTRVAWAQRFDRFVEPSTAYDTKFAWRDGELWGWGSNAACQLARDPALLAISDTPVKLELAVPGLTSLEDARTIAISNGFGCVLSDDGRLWCWGTSSPDYFDSGRPCNPELVRVAGPSQPAP